MPEIFHVCCQYEHLYLDSDLTTCWQAILFPRQKDTKCTSLFHNWFGRHKQIHCSWCCWEDGKCPLCFAVWVDGCFFVYKHSRSADLHDAESPPSGKISASPTLTDNHWPNYMLNITSISNVTRYYELSTLAAVAAFSWVIVISWLHRQ